MKSSMKRSGFGLQTLYWDFKIEPPKSFILEWLRRIQACFSFSCVLNLLKSWSNLGLDQDSNGHKHSEKIKKWKPKHIAFLCHIYIVSIQVDRYEQGLDIFKTEKACIYPWPLTIYVLWSQAWREVVLGFKHGNFKLMNKF
jgi:hypothetical protein